MFRTWFAARRSLVLTVASSSVVAVLVAAVAIVSSGYTAQKLDLGDGGVWVSNGEQQAVGRVNTAIHELDSIVEDTGSDVELLQSGSTVLVVDATASTVSIVDAATSESTDSVPLPPEQPQVFLAGDNAVVLARGTGELWVTPTADLAAFDAESPATLSLGTDAVASVDQDGHMFAYSPGTQLVYTIDAANGGAVESTEKVDIAPGALSISAVADHWAVLDSASRQLYLSGRTVELGEGSGTPVLQLPGKGSTVLVADSSTLRSVPIAGGDPVVETSGQSGTATAPVVVGGCIYAAWTSGSAFRKCAADDAAGVTLTLGSLQANAQLAFHSNAGKVLLGDSRAGSAWAVQDSGELIDNWAAVTPPDDAQQEEVTNEDSVPDIDPAQRPPVAVDDEFGARPGRSTVLPVLLNDYDPNGDVLVLAEAPELDESLGRVDLINNRQQLQITLGAGASGEVNFSYSIDDGRGGTATATVRVTVHRAGQNSAPEQVRTSKSVVAVGGRVTTQVLGDWVDPDGDPFYLARAATDGPDAVTSKPSGTVVFSDGGSGADVADVELVVSDGSAEGTGSLAVTVRAVGTVPIIAEPFIVIASAGEEITVSPLEHVRGGSGTLRLNSVPSSVGVSITPNYEAGTFRLVSSAVATHYLEYVVTDGDQSVTGVVRVEVTAPPETNTRPITIPKTVFVQALHAERVDVAGTDIDPAGGVLVVTALNDLDPAAGVAAEILDQSIVRVRLESPLDAAVVFGYTVSNGLTEAQGTITVIEIPTPDTPQPPVANDDEVTVRVGAAIDIPVLANDESPDGGDLTLVPTLATDLPDGAGLLFSSGRVLRYLAPDRTGNFVAVYEVEGSDGQRARAQLKISVREVDADTNSAPTPGAVTARVLAGESVRIPIPLNGIDADGDTVQLIGQESNPEKGSVIEVGSDSITYRAGEYSVGTDSFQYTVIDALGARATGIVRVGISARASGARNPVAILDEVTVRPGVTVSVQVLANDSDPDGGTLRVISAVGGDGVTASISGDTVAVRPPDAEGTYGVVYTISNDLGGTSSNFVRVVVDADAPFSAPVVGDSVLGLADILNHSTIDVDVLANVFFADGDPQDLGLSVYADFASTARVTPKGLVRVTVTAESQIIAFRVTHPEDPSVFSYGFIWVPGFNDALPQINTDAPPLTVRSGQSLTVELNDYVLAVGDRRVQLTDTSTVRATHANGDDLVIDRDTIQFTSADRYFGAASVSFTITDGESADDPDGRTATLVLPITVEPRENQPPVFSGAVLEFEPAQTKEIDLTRLTSYPYPDDVNELAYTVLSPLPEGFTYSMDGQILTLRANESATVGDATTMSLGVRDATAAGTAGRIQLRVVPSTRPLASPADDVALVPRGRTTVVDVLANDEATNPFPETPLRVVSIRGADSASLPSGVSVTPNADSSRLTIQVSDDARPTDTVLQYQVMDATGDTSRAVWGEVRISVQDAPDPVTDVHVTDFGDKSLTVAWSSGADNNAPITGYDVVLTNESGGTVIGRTQCGGAQCTVSTAGNGPDNAVRVSVVARNAIGPSDSSSLGGTVWSDVVPAAPDYLQAAPADHGLRISWRKPASTGGSEVTRYIITVDGASAQEVTVPATDAVGTQYSRTITDSAISNGSTVSFSVSGRNAASSTLAVWNKATASGRPAGAPVKLSAPTAVANIGEGTSATLTWPDAFDSNGRAITGYYAAVFTGTAPTCTISGDLPGTAQVDAHGATVTDTGTGTSATFDGLTPNVDYTFVVFATNGMGCTASATVAATPRARPGTVTAVTITGPEANGDARWDFRLAGFTIASGSTDADTYLYRLGGDAVEGGEHGPRSPGSFLETSDDSQYGTAVTVQVKACKVYGSAAPLCSADWSAPFDVGTPVRNSALGGLMFTHTEFGVDGIAATGQFSWDTAPTGQYDSITYSCGDATLALAAGAGSCDVVETGTPPDGEFPSLTVTITVGGADYVRTYPWATYD